MSCSTCSATMQCVEKGVFYCHRCGTLRVMSRSDSGYSGDVYVPKLVERCRAFEGSIRGNHTISHSADELVSGLRIVWIRIGIAESIDTPENRKGM